MNAKVLSPENEDEEYVMGKYTITNGRTPADLKDGTDENRRLLLNFCIENGIKLTNTTFNKNPKKLITYRPLGVDKDAPISEETHEQIDYIMTKQEPAATITDCETDTNITINTDHYPMLAKTSVKFRRINKEQKEIYRYNDKTIWKDKEQMNKTITELLNNREGQNPNRRARKARQYLRERERDMVGLCEPIPPETLERAFTTEQISQIQTAHQNCREYAIRRTLAQYEQEDNQEEQYDNQYTPADHNVWKEFNKAIVEAQPKRNQSARKDNLSDDTRKLIKNKAKINPITEHRKWKRIQKKIKKQREIDKVEWINELVSNSKNTKDLFAGINEIGRKF